LRGFALQLGLRKVQFNESRETLPTSEIVNKSGRLSPFEDLKRRTLSRIDGLWERFVYVTKLRSSDGRYEHWGHNRTYGERDSQEAIGKAHSELYLELLRTPLPELMKDWESNNVQSPPERIEFSELMIPENLNGGSTRHLNSVVLAAHLLQVERLASTRSIA
jgi:hypothetical protein